MISRLTRFITTKRFFYWLLFLYFLESAWIALSAIYPQAFDEDFHFGLIKIYSHHLLPFLSSQPPGANRYGAVAQDPSYLFHYLMSFPYRFIEHFTHDQTIQIICLRFIDIILFGIGLLLFRKVLLRTGLSERVTNLSLLIFILVPIVPQLAGQINYDNLLFLMVPLTCLLTFNMAGSIREKVMPFKDTLLLLSVCLLASLVTYAFLPIFLAVVVFLAVYSFRHFRNKPSLLFRSFIKQYSRSGTVNKVLMISLTVLSIVLFFQRYGLNLIDYHSINPDCAKILGVKNCSQYSAWYYDYTNRQIVKNNSIHVSGNILYYIGQWLYWMWFRLFFAVNGPISQFRNYPPLPLPALAALLLALTGAVAVFKYWRTIFKGRPYNVFLALAFLMYAGALFFKGYVTYVDTYVLENMNGRYLVAVLPLLIPILIIGMRRLFTGRDNLKKYVMIAAVIMFIEGGGTLTFITRSNNHWYWKDSTVQNANEAARDATKYLIIKGSKYYSGKMWHFN